MDNKKVSHVICPYCCFRFEPSEAHFRIKQTQNRDIAKVGRDGKAESKTDDKVLDQMLLNYYMDILQLDEQNAIELSMQSMHVTINDTEVSFEEEEMAAYGFPQNITYKGVSQAAEKRLCPFCHNDLPIGYGLRNTLLISILGDARAGKSIYLTMLINELENNKDFVSKLSFIGNNATKERLFENYQKPLLEAKTLVESTKRNRIPPFAYNYWYRYKDGSGAVYENTLDLIFYDIAGEDLRDSLDMKKNGFNIKDSSGLIFLLDPTNFKKMEDIFMLEDRLLVESVPKENSSKDIFSAMFNYFLGMNTEKSEIPLAMTVSKVDLFNCVDLNFFQSRPESRILNLLANEEHKGFFDMRSTRALNSEVRELLEHLDEETVLNYAMGCFRQVQCFAVSSLGKKPLFNEDKTGYIEGGLEPFRVKEPFYWILYKNNLLYKYEDLPLHEEVAPSPVFLKKFVQSIKNIFKFND